MNQKTFIRGNDLVNELMARPGMAEAVTKIAARADEDDKVYAKNLAEIREAVNLTQNDLAIKLAVTQGSISRIENRGDVLLSTLRNYLEATGASDPRIVVILDGRQVELDLTHIESRAASRGAPRSRPKRQSRKAPTTTGA